MEILVKIKSGIVNNFLEETLVLIKEKIGRIEYQAPLFNNEIKLSVDTRKNFLELDEIKSEIIDIYIKKGVDKDNIIYISKNIEDAYMDISYLMDNSIYC